MTAVRPRARPRLSFDALKYASFAHSAVYCCLLVAWQAPGLEGAEAVFGWGHGLGWIGISLACLAAVRTRVIPLWLAVTVAIIGGVGPFAGSIGFVVEDRRRTR